MVAAAMLLEGLVACCFPNALLRKLDEIAKVADAQKVRTIGFVCALIGIGVIVLIGVPD